MKASEKLAAILEYLDISANKFSKEIGLANNANIYHLKNDRNDISINLSHAIRLRYPEFNRDWLLHAKGDMLLNKDNNNDIPSSNDNEKFIPEGRVIEDDEYYIKDFYLVPAKGRGVLENSLYDPIYFKDLRVEKTLVKKQASKGSIYFKIEVEGVSMDNGKKHSLAEGDWAYCRSIDRKYWLSKFHTHTYEMFCFFHMRRGIIFKKIKEQNVETGELLLTSLHPDKERFPDFTITVYECSYICNVFKITTDL